MCDHLINMPLMDSAFVALVIVVAVVGSVCAMQAIDYLYQISHGWIHRKNCLH